MVSSRVVMQVQDYLDETRDYWRGYPRNIRCRWEKIHSIGHYIHRRIIAQEIADAEGIAK